MRCFFILFILTMVNCHNSFTTLFSWKQLNYTLMNEHTRGFFLGNKNDVQDNAIPYNLNVWDDHLFLTVIHYSNRLLANLNYVNITAAKANNEISPLLNPYPDHEFNRIIPENSSGNIRRFAIDACDRQWAIDDGDIIGDSTIPKKKLIAIDLITNMLILSYVFNDDIQRNSLLVNIIVDTDPQNCTDTHVYTIDREIYGIVVYSMAKNSCWRITHNYFHADSFNGYFNVDGRMHRFDEGLTGLVLSPSNKDGSKTLYFHSLSRTQKFSISTDVLRNKTALNSYHLRRFHISNRGPIIQATSSVLDENTGIIYFTQVFDNAITCWDTRSKSIPKKLRIVAQDDKKLIYPNDINIDRKTQKIYVLANNLPALSYGKYKYKQLNYHVLVASLDALTTACRKQLRYPLLPSVSKSHVCCIEMTQIRIALMKSLIG